jgi:hypothetical protein
MRNLKAGVALALAGSLALAPLQAAGQNKGFLSGDARAESKQPFSDFSVRARNTATGAIEATAILDSQGNFMLDGLSPGKLSVELTKVGQNKVLCSAGPFEIKPGAASADAAFGQSNIGISCNRPVAAWLLLAAAAAAGVTAGVVSGGPADVPAGPTVGPVVTPTTASASQ